MSDNELSWDEKANAKANVQWYNPDHGDGDCMKCQVNFQVREGFEMGAKWQRDQLRTDEATERVARELYIRDFIDPEKGERRWAKLGDGRRYNLQHARAAITALIGEEP